MANANINNPMMPEPIYAGTDPEPRKVGGSGTIAGCGAGYAEAQQGLMVGETGGAEYEQRRAARHQQDLRITALHIASGLGAPRGISASSDIVAAASMFANFLEYGGVPDETKT